MKQLARVEIERMRQFADFLETVPPREFDLNEWEAREATAAKTMLFGLIKLEPACGFAGCAMGWAAHSNAFEGLILIEGEPVYKGFGGYRAAQKLLGIKSNAAHFLFGPERYAVDDPEPGHVAARLRKFADKVESRLKRARPSSLALRVVS